MGILQDNTKLSWTYKIHQVFQRTEEPAFQNKLNPSTVSLAVGNSKNRREKMIRQRNRTVAV